MVIMQEAIIWFNSLAPQNMGLGKAYCLMAPSHYMSQYWLSAIRSSGIHQRIIS